MSIYGCHNAKPLVAGKPYLVQDGWNDSYVTMTRTPRMKAALHVLSTDCQFSQDKPNDPHCAGCKRYKGERKDGQQ